MSTRTHTHETAHRERGRAHTHLSGLAGDVAVEADALVVRDEELVRGGLVGAEARVDNLLEAMVERDELAAGGAIGHDGDGLDHIGVGDAHDALERVRLGVLGHSLAEIGSEQHLGLVLIGREHHSAMGGADQARGRHELCHLVSLSLL